MTEQYLIGELSVRLEQLQAASTPDLALDVARLREQVECGPPAGLGCAALCALAIADRLCSASLSRGDVTAFVRQAEIAAELHMFGKCARLLTEG